MDEKDRQIIWALQKDGRLSNQDLSEKVALSPSPCLRRLRLLEEAKIIKGYTAIVDEEAYGLPITAFVRIRLERHSEASVAAFERNGGKNAPLSYTVAYIARAVSPGRYVAPAAVIEDMYRPDRFGRTGFGTIEITSAR